MYGDSTVYYLTYFDHEFFDMLAASSGCRGCLRIASYPISIIAPLPYRSRRLHLIIIWQTTGSELVYLVALDLSWPRTVPERYNVPGVD